MATSRDDYVTPYSKANPPANIKEAEEAIEDLTISFGEIENQLEYANRDTYDSTEEFRRWHRKATNALSWTDLEISFLRRWILAERQRLSDAELNPIAQGLWGHIQEGITWARSEGLPRYTRSVLPENLDAAYDRNTFLNEAKTRFNVFSDELKELLYVYQLPHQQKRLLGIQSMMRKIRDVIEFESRVIAQYIEQQRGRDCEQIRLIVNALTLAIAEGFILQPDEQAALDSFQEPPNE